MKRKLLLILITFSMTVKSDISTTLPYSRGNVLRSISHSRLKDANVFMISNSLQGIPSILKILRPGDSMEACVRVRISFNTI